MVSLKNIKDEVAEALFPVIKFQTGTGKIIKSIDWFHQTIYQYNKSTI